MAPPNRMRVSPHHANLSPLLGAIFGSGDLKVNPDALVQQTGETAKDVQMSGPTEGGEPLGQTRITYQTPLPLSQQHFVKPWKDPSTWQHITGQDAADKANQQAAVKFHDSQVALAQHQEQLAQSGIAEKAAIEVRNALGLQNQQASGLIETQQAPDLSLARRGIIPTDANRQPLSDSTQQALLGTNAANAATGNLAANQALTTLAARQRYDKIAQATENNNVFNAYNQALGVGKGLVAQDALAPDALAAHQAGLDAQTALGLYHANTAGQPAFPFRPMGSHAMQDIHGNILPNPYGSGGSALGGLGDVLGGKVGGVPVGNSPTNNVPAQPTTQKDPSYIYHADGSVVTDIDGNPTRKKIKKP